MIKTWLFFVVLRPKMSGLIYICAAVKPTRRCRYISKCKYIYNLWVSGSRSSFYNVRRGSPLSRSVYAAVCMKKTKKVNYYVLWLRRITVNLVRPNADHHCLPTGETVNTLADIWGRLVCSESEVEVEAQMNLSDKCSWSMCCRLCFGEAPDWDLSLTEAKQSMPDH